MKKEQSSKLIRVDVTLYRKSPESTTTIVNDERVSGDLYREYAETWERPYGEEHVDEKTRLSQNWTGREFKYVTTYSSEFVEDMQKIKGVDMLEGHVAILDPTDFSYIMLKEVK